jgi:hypothetical protein
MLQDIARCSRSSTAGPCFTEPASTTIAILPVYAFALPQRLRAARRGVRLLRPFATLRLCVVILFEKSRVRHAGGGLMLRCHSADYPVLEIAMPKKSDLDPTRECAICYAAHDEAIHEATVRVREWFRQKVTRSFAEAREVHPIQVA